MGKTFKNPILNFLFIIRFYIYKGLNFISFYFLNLYYKKKDIYLFILQNHGIGDHLMLTSIIGEWAKSKKIIIISLRPEVYNNLNVKNIGLKRSLFNGEIISFLGNSNHSNIIGYSNGNRLYKSSNPYSIKHKTHLREALVYGRPDIQRKIKDISHDVRIVFGETEFTLFEKKYSYLSHKPYAIITSNERGGDFLSSRSLPIERLQKIINETNKKINWVHLGISGDKKLQGVIDLRGKSSLRETFYIVSKSKLIFCTEGMFTHLSSAFNIPCITLFGAFPYPELSSYDNVIPIIPTPFPNCAYCWKNPCPKYKKPKCIENIKTKTVIELIKKTWKISIKRRG